MFFKRKYLFIQYLFGHRVVSSTTPGITRQKTLYGQQASFKGSMFCKRLYAIYRTGRSVPTGRSQQRRNAILVNPNDKDKNFSQYPFHILALNAKSAVLFFFPQENNPAALSPYKPPCIQYQKNATKDLGRGAVCFFGMPRALIA